MIVYIPDETVKQMPNKFIMAMNQPETGPYKSCARVIASNHPRFIPGYRFDFGFLHIALDEGYTVVYIGNQTPSLEARWKDLDGGWDLKGGYK